MAAIPRHFLLDHLFLSTWDIVLGRTAAGEVVSLAKRSGERRGRRRKKEESGFNLTFCRATREIEETLKEEEKEKENFFFRLRR